MDVHPWCCTLCGFGLCELQRHDRRAICVGLAQFVWAWLRSEMLEPKQIKFEPVNIYYEALKDAIDEHEKEVSKHND